MNLRSFLFLLLSRARNPQPETWNAHGISGNVFANSPAYSSTPWCRMINSRDVSATGKILVQASTRQPEAESGDRDKDTIPTPRFLRSPSARYSFNPLEGKTLKNYGTDQQRLQISELHFDKFLTPHTFSCWKMRFKTEVRFCSNFPKEAMLLIKEVKMVNSVDDLKSSCSIQRTNPFPDFEVLDANIASALNKIIQNSCFKKEVSLEEQKVLKANQFLRGGHRDGAPDACNARGTPVPLEYTENLNMSEIPGRSRERKVGAPVAGPFLCACNPSRRYSEHHRTAIAKTRSEKCTPSLPMAEDGRASTGAIQHTAKAVFFSCGGARIRSVST